MNRNDIAISYREAAVRGAGQLELVVMLYDILFDDIQRAIAAIRACDIESRTIEIKHALGVLEQLQGTLNFDEGGETARSMDRLYSIVRAKLLEAHLKSSEEILKKQVELLAPIRDAWKQISPSHPKPAEYAPPTHLDDLPTTEWRT
jgi:flagellar protein FliS